MPNAKKLFLVNCNVSFNRRTLTTVIVILRLKFKPDAIVNRKNDLILIMTAEKQNKTLELSKHRFPDSTPARNEVKMKTRYPVIQ